VRLRQLASILAVGLAIASATSVSAQSNVWGWGGIVGSWRIQVTLPPGASVCPPTSPSPCVIAAMATANADGGVVQTAAIPGVSSGHGAWIRTGGRRFRIESTYFRFGSTGELVGTSVTVTLIDVDQTGHHADGTFTNTLFDLAGLPIGTFSGSASADKIVL
jgi:hypothetical protein